MELTSFEVFAKNHQIWVKTGAVIFESQKLTWGHESLN